METSSRPHAEALLLSSPGIGHRTPLLVLANRLITHHGFHVTLFSIPTPSSLSSPQELHLLHQPPTTTKNNALRIFHLPPININSGGAVVTQLIVTAREACANLLAPITNAMDSPPNVIIADFFCFEAHKAARELHVPFYLYFPTSAWFFVLTRSIPVLDKEVEGEYMEQEEPLRLPLPGCKPVRPVDVIEPMMDRKDQQYREYVGMGEGLCKADGFLLNTWDDMEPSTFRALRTYLPHVPVYPIGPLTKPVEPVGLNREVMEFLDRQQSRSVIYVAFGSGGTLSIEQMEELAMGLEQSKQRFLWAARAPLLTFNRESPLGFLSEGFLDRTKNVGLVVPNWAQQREILAHVSVGGFLTHCGWNSIMESISNGVPMVAWPLYAEQKMNATLLVEDVGIAVRPKGLPMSKEGGVVEREEVERVVRMVMEEDSKEGRAMRERVNKLKLSALRALDDDGCSYNSLCQFVHKCTKC